MAYTLPGSNTVTGTAQGPTGYNWTAPYTQWTDAQRQQASQFIQPLLASGDYAQIGRAAQQLGVNPFALNTAVSQTALNNPNAEGNNPGYGPAGMSGVGDMMRQYATQFGSLNPNTTQSTPFTGYTYNPTQTQNLKTFFGLSTSQIPNYEHAVNYLTQQGYNPFYTSYLVNKADSSNPQASLQSANDYVNMRFNNEFMRGSNRDPSSMTLNTNKFSRALTAPRPQNRTFGAQWGGVGGLLGMPGQQGQTNPYPMTQYAPQTNWQSLAGLLSQQAFGG